MQKISIPEKFTVRLKGVRKWDSVIAEGTPEGRAQSSPTAAQCRVGARHVGAGVRMPGSASSTTTHAL